MENNWKYNLAQYGALHNEDCCVNFPEDSRACDVGTADDDCCDNMRMASSFFKEEAAKLIEFISHDMKCADEKQRRAVVTMYKEHFELIG